MHDRIGAGPYALVDGAIRDGLAVYCATYDAIAAAEPDASGLLDAHEANRARRFVYDEDRKRFVLAHAYLRRIAAGHCGQPVEHLRLSTEENRSPVMLDDAGVTCLQLSLSHCRSHAAVAVSDRSAIGVDVENLRPMAQCAELAPLVCSPDEQAQLFLTSPDAYPLAFCRMWTAKEAISKATGLGLGMDFAGISRSNDGPDYDMNDLYIANRECYQVHTRFVSPDCVLSWVVLDPIDSGS